MTDETFPFGNDDAQAAAYILALRTALFEAVKELAEIYGPEGAERMAEFEANVMKSVKSTVTEGMSYGAEARIQTHAVGLVQAVMKSAIKAANEDEGPPSS